MTIGQRCRDWFECRRFALTGTTTHAILPLVARAKAAEAAVDGVPVDEQPAAAKALVEETRRNVFLQCRSSWFDANRRSSKAMKAGHANEPRVLNRLRRMPVVLALFEVGLLANREFGCIGTSPDGIALLSDEGGSHGGIMVAAVEIKTTTSAASCAAASAARQAASTEDTGAPGNKHFHALLSQEARLERLIPEKVHRGQVMHHMLTTGMPCLFVVAAPTGRILYSVLVEDSGSQQLRTYRRDVVAAAEYLGIVAMYSNEQYPRSPPAACPDWLKPVWASYLTVWVTVRHHILTTGPLPPVRRFKHSSQVLYNKTMPGADGSSKIDNNIHVCVNIGFEAKYTLRLFKHALRAAWSAFKVLKKEPQVLTAGNFELHLARKHLNKAATHTQFVIKVAIGLLKALGAQAAARESAEAEVAARAGDNGGAHLHQGAANPSAAATGAAAGATPTQQRRALEARIEQLLRQAGRPGRMFKFKHFTKEPWHSLRLLPVHHNTNWTVAQLVAWRAGKEADPGSMHVLPCVYCGCQFLGEGIRHTGNTTRACQVCRVPLCRHCAVAWHSKQELLTGKNRDTPVVKATLAKVREKRGRAHATTAGDAGGDDDSSDDRNSEREGGAGSLGRRPRQRQRRK